MHGNRGHVCRVDVVDSVSTLARIEATIHDLLLLRLCVVML